jgi:hypothetical protein
MVGQLLVSPNCVFDASLVPETCLDRFVDLKGFTQQVYGESRYRRCEVILHLSGFGCVNQASTIFILILWAFWVRQ